MACEFEYEKVKELVESAFPNGDLKSHHEFHLDLIEKAKEEERIAAEKSEEKKQIRLEVKKKVVSGIVWAVIFVALSIIAERLFGVRLS